MRHHTILTTLVAAMIGASAAHGQGTPAAPAPAPAEKKALQIVFVPQDLIEKNKKSGKLKEDTFYWTNATNNPDYSPKGMEEEGKPFLRVEGHSTATDQSTTGEKQKARAESRTTVTRAFTVPAGAKKATAKLIARATHDVWSDTGGGAIFSNTLLTKDGKGLWASFGKPDLNKGWQTKTSVIELHEGTQQLVVELATEGKTPLDIAALEVTFE